MSANRIRQFMDERSLTVEQLARESGLGAEILHALRDDERLLPDPVALEALWRTYQADPNDLVVLQPANTGSLPGFSAGEPLAVTVVGAGNLGHVFTGVLAARPDTHVRLLVSTEERAGFLRGRVEAHGGIGVSARDGVTTGLPSLITADPEAAVSGARLVFICVPSFLHEDALTRVLPHLSAGSLVGAVPAAGGFDWKARHMLAEHNSQATIFGIGVIPWMCKVATAGEEVRVLGRKRQNVQATFDAERRAEVSDLLTALLDMPVLDAGSFLNLTLNSGNQLLHPAIMYDLFESWDGTPLPEPPLFYENLSESAAELLGRMSDEVLGIRAVLEAGHGLRLPLVQPLQLSTRLAYGTDVQDPSTLRSTIATNRSYATIRAPMRQVPGGWAPDWGSRFFGEDIPHGLVVLRGVAELLGVEVPAMDQLLLWAQRKMGREYLRDGRLSGPDVANSGAPQRFGIRTLEQLPV